MEKAWPIYSCHIFSEFRVWVWEWVAMARYGPYMAIFNPGLVYDYECCNNGKWAFPLLSFICLLLSCSFMYVLSSCTSHRVD